MEGKSSFEANFYLPHITYYILTNMFKVKRHSVQIPMANTINKFNKIIYIILLIMVINSLSPMQVLAASDGYFRNIYLDDNTQIQSNDPNHRILFRRSENKLELREYGNIIFSSGATSGQETSSMVVKPKGNIDIGNSYNYTNPTINLMGPNYPFWDGSMSSINFKFNSAGSARISSVRGTSWDTYLQFWATASNQGSDTPKKVMEVSYSGIKIDGSVKAKEIFVTTNVWADYVFDKNYKLQSIPDLKKYIDENKHLPNVPSAQEIQEKGISVGEMQKIQMEKIEELTLYTIQLEKRISELESKLNKLTDR